MPLFNNISSSSLKFIQLLDSKSANISGGQAGVVGSWYSRTINTIKQDDTGLVSLSSNLFTLPAGTYVIDSTAAFNRIDRCRMRLRNTTDNTVLLSSLSAYFNNSAGVAGELTLSGEFSVVANKQLAIEYRTQSRTGTQDLGIESNFGLEEIYLIANIWKIG